MSHVFPRDSRTTAPIAVSGEGCYLVDANGKQYFDGSGGAAVSCLGHNDAEVKAAIIDQLEHLAFAHTGFFSSAPAEALADALAKAAQDRLGHFSTQDLANLGWALARAGQHNSGSVTHT